jgi:tellurite resistance protein TerC
MLAELFPPQLWPILQEAVPVIVSLIIIEGLLSVDNALAIAAMASHLPEKQRFWALKVGILGAYVFRGLALLFATLIIENPWLKLIGAAYLIHLMAHHFAGKHAAKSGVHAAAHAVHRGFWGTVASIELMDLSLGVDNVVAAVALSDEFWVVCTGVFVGILALRFVAGYCIGLIEKYPILQHTAFLLIGFVGMLLVVELSFHVDITTLNKFIGIVAIIALSIVYSKQPRVKALMKPTLYVLMLPVRAYEVTAGTIFHLLFWPFQALFKRLKVPEPAGEVEHAEEILHETAHRR